MYKAPALAIAAIFALSEPAMIGRSLAADNANIIIIGEDSDRDTVPRSSRVFKGVLDELSNQLQDRGFAVYDETAITLGAFAQGRTRRTNAELIDIVRSVSRPPLDVAVIFSIYSQVTELTYTIKVVSRIAGRLINVVTGRHLGGFEVKSPRSLRAPTDCDRECLLELVGRDTRRLSRQLGGSLAEKLSSMVRENRASDGAPGTVSTGMSAAYTLVFDGFSANEVSEMEEYLVVFSGYQYHRPIGTSLKQHEYWYETASARARLNRNLNKMLEHLDIEGNVRLSGNLFTVEKTALHDKVSSSWDDW